MGTLPYPQVLTVPAFFYIDTVAPDGSGKLSWDEIRDAGAAVGIVVADNSVFLGPAPSNVVLSPAQIAQAKAKFGECQAKGQKVFGYVDTSSTLVAPSLVQSWIRTWYNKYYPNIDGIFFDQGPSFDPDVATSLVQAGRVASSSDVTDTYFQGYYLPLFHFLRTDPSILQMTNNVPPLVYVNASQFPSEWLAKVVDFLNVWELPWARYQGTGFVAESSSIGVNQLPPPGWWTDGTYVRKVVHIVTECFDPSNPNATQSQAVAACVQLSASPKRNAGLMYAFNGDANYTNLPPYFEQLVTLHQAASVVAGVGDNVG